MRGLFFGNPVQLGKELSRRAFARQIISKKGKKDFFNHPLVLLYELTAVDNLLMVFL